MIERGCFLYDEIAVNKFLLMPDRDKRFINPAFLFSERQGRGGGS
jgi:hypothetical protein